MIFRDLEKFESYEKNVCRFLRANVFSLFNIHSLFRILAKALDTWKHSENDSTINYL